MKAIQRPDGSIEYDGTPEELRAMLKGPERTVTLDKVGTKRPRRKRASPSGSLSGDIRAFFTKHKGEEVKMADVTAALSTHSPIDVSSAVNKMSKAKNAVIERVSHGTYKMNG